MIDASRLYFESHDVKIRFTMDALGITREEAEQVWAGSDKDYAEVETGDEHD